MNTDKFAINWQNFARVRLQLKFAFILRSLIFINLLVMIICFPIFCEQPRTRIY